MLQSDRIPSLLLPPASACYPLRSWRSLALIPPQAVSIGLAQPFAAFSRSGSLYIVQRYRHIGRLWPLKLDLGTLIYPFGDIPLQTYDKLNTLLAIGLVVPALLSVKYLTPMHLAPFSLCRSPAPYACSPPALHILPRLRDPHILQQHGAYACQPHLFAWLHGVCSLARLLTRRIFPPNRARRFLLQLRPRVPAGRFLQAFRLLAAASIPVAFVRMPPFVFYCMHTTFFKHLPSPVFILDAHLLPAWPELPAARARSLCSGAMRFRVPAFATRKFYLPYSRFDFRLVFSSHYPSDLAPFVPARSSRCPLFTNFAPPVSALSSIIFPRVFCTLAHWYTDVPREL
ncbi:hypothetical protein C8R45DRAFT_1212389 [Mycena sanguinolenta]|nr:hypothetical protein C8R45DRAFT_1212389 [Mycena sanguinolenta]